MKIKPEDITLGKQGLMLLGVLCLHSTIMTPTIEVQSTFRNVEGCFGSPKLTSHNWRVKEIRDNTVKFENGNVLYKDAVKLWGTC